MSLFECICWDIFAGLMGDDLGGVELSQRTHQSSTVITLECSGATSTKEANLDLELSLTTTLPRTHGVNETHPDVPLFLLVASAGCRRSSRGTS